MIKLLSINTYDRIKVQLQQCNIYPVIMQPQYIFFNEMAILYSIKQAVYACMF